MGVFGVCAGGGYALAVAQTERRFKAVAGVSATPMGEAARRFFGSPIPPAEQIKSLEAAAAARTAAATLSYRSKGSLCIILDKRRVKAGFKGIRLTFI
jgi:hypothetical protein